VVNVVTKSGGNDFSGSVFGYSGPNWLQNDFRQLSTTNGVVNQEASQTHDVGATFAGPLVRNRLFFFGALDPQWETATFRAPSEFPLASLGDVDRDRRVVNYAGKVTWQFSSKTPTRSMCPYLATHQMASMDRSERGPQESTIRFSVRTRQGLAASTSTAGTTRA
jgi:hypothetical protein